MENSELVNGLYEAKDRGKVMDGFKFLERNGIVVEYKNLTTTKKSLDWVCRVFRVDRGQAVRDLNKYGTVYLSDDGYERRLKVVKDFVRTLEYYLKGNYSADATHIYYGENSELREVNLTFRSAINRDYYLKGVNKKYTNINAIIHGLFDESVGSVDIIKAINDKNVTRNDITDGKAVPNIFAKMYFNDLLKFVEDYVELPFFADVKKVVEAILNKIEGLLKDKPNSNSEIKVFDLLKTLDVNDIPVAYGNKSSTLESLRRIVEYMELLKYDNNLVVEQDFQTYGTAFLDVELLSVVERYIKGIKDKSFIAGCFPVEKWMTFKKPAILTKKERSDKSYKYDIIDAEQVLNLVGANSVDVNRIITILFSCKIYSDCINKVITTDFDGEAQDVPFDIALEFFTALKKRIPKEFPKIQYFQDVIFVIGKLIDNLNKRTSAFNDPTPRGKPPRDDKGSSKTETYYDVLTMFNGARLTKNISLVSSKDKISKVMIQYVKKFGNCSDGDIIAGDKKLLVSEACVKSVVTQINKDIDMNPLSQVIHIEKINNLNSLKIQVRVEEGYDNDYSGSVLREAVISLKEQEAIVKKAVNTNGNVDLYELFYNLQFNAPTEISSLLRKLKIEPLSYNEISKEDASKLFKWMYDETRKMTAFKYKFPYVMEQAQYWHRCYTYFGNVNESFDCGDLETNLAINKQMIVDEITEKILEKLQFELKNLKFD